MKLSQLARLSTCSLLLCLCPALLGHCGGTASGEHGTETGNPPVVDGQKLRLTLREAGAELNGEPGAVSPGAIVRLENRSTGASTETTAGADGSFQVLVPGTALDTYEVTITYRGGTVTLPVTVAPEDREVAPLDAATCQQLENDVREQLRLAFEPAAQGCSKDSDCQVRYWNVGCYAGCDYSYFAADSPSTAFTTAEQSIAPLCTELQRCERQPPPACNAGYVVAECNQGTCQGLNLVDVDCADISSRAASRLADALDTADRSCSVDADCQLVSPELSCAAGCGYPASVTTSAAQTLFGNISDLEGRYCSTFALQSCPVSPEPSCPNLYNLYNVASSCTRGRCEVLPVTELP
ncbi:MAG: hypothetical protein RL033_7841 [Pseudomonadota bacterium]